MTPCNEDCERCVIPHLKLSADTSVTFRYDQRVAIDLAGS